MLDLSLGEKGEVLAAQLLSRQKFIILAKNYRCQIGEVDLIASRSKVLHFIEVKTRSSINFGRPAEAVNTTKQQKLRQLALYYMAENNYDGAVSFGVVEVLYGADGVDPEINFIPEAF
ncbi:MAG: YraN family protein [Patescibacteria group bacterium]